MRILAEKDWESDANVRFCGKCSKGFGLMNRKSHCRCCGRVFCGDCVMHFEGMLEAPGASSPAKGTTKACNGCIVAERRKTAAAAAAKSTSATNDESPLAQSSSFAGSPSTTTFTNNGSMVRDSSRRESVAPGESGNAEPTPLPPTTTDSPSSSPPPKSDDGQGGAAALHRDPHSEPAALQPHRQHEEGSKDAKAASSVPLDDETTTTTTTKVEGTSSETGLPEKAVEAEAAPPPLYSNLSFSAGSLEKTATMVDFCDDCGCLLDRCICPPKPEGAGSTTTASAEAAAATSTAQQPPASTTTTTTVPPPPPRPVNTVVLVIRRGEKLINVDGFGQGLSDPYVIVLNRDGTELYRTCVIDDNLNPQWPPEKATCTWTFADASTESLTLQVWDKDTVGTDDFMGEAVVPAMQFLHVLNGEVSAPLQPRVHETSSSVKKHAGKLGMLTFAWLTTPAPVEDEEEEAEEEAAAESGKVEDTAATAEADVARSPLDEASKDPIAAEGENKEEVQPSHKEEEEKRSRASQEEENGMANSHAQCDTVGQASPGGSSTAAPSDRQPAGGVEEVEEVEPSVTNMEESVAIFPAPLAASSTTQPTASAAPKAASYVPPTTEARTALQRATRFILPQEHIVFCLFAGKTRHFRLQRRFVILTSHGNLLYTDDEKNELKGNLSLRGKALHSVLKDYQSSNCKFTVVCDGKDYPFTTEKDEDRKEFVRLLPTVL